MQDLEFDECLSSKETKAWLQVKNVIPNFLGNHKFEHYKLTNSISYKCILNSFVPDFFREIINKISVGYGR